MVNSKFLAFIVIGFVDYTLQGMKIKVDMPKQDNFNHYGGVFKKIEGFAHAAEIAEGLSRNRKKRISTYVISTRSKFTYNNIQINNHMIFCPKLTSIDL